MDIFIFWMVNFSHDKNLMELKTDTFANNKILRASNELSFQQNNLALDLV